MNKTDKHTPLSPEELLKLLSDQASPAAPSDSELDEFEREALEGFALHSTPEKAEALIEEMDKAIARKVDATREPAKRVRKYWFSAAACLLSVLIISIAYYTNTHRPDSIALNQPTDTSVMPPSYAPPADLLMSSDKPSGSSDQVMELNTEQSAQVAKKDHSPRNEQPLVYHVNQEGRTDEKSRLAETVTVSVIEEDSDKKKTVSEGISSHILDTDISFAKAEAPATAGQEVTSYNYQDKEVKDQQEDVQVKAAKAKYAPKIAAANQQVSGTTAPIIDTSPYYPGGDTALKQAILDYMKKNDPTVRFQGEFHIKISISETGVVDVLDIQHHTPDCKKCVKALKQALKSLTGWIPGTLRGNNHRSEKDFVLRF